MSKAVLVSIRPEWCEKIAFGEKTIEVRKTRPKLTEPFKCYIYCTRGSPYLNRHNGKLYLEAKDILGGKGTGLYERLSGLVIGEFVCDRVEGLTRVGFSGSREEPKYCVYNLLDMRTKPIDGILADGCLSLPELEAYLAGAVGYAWHISDLVIYDNPKELSEFEGLQKTRFGYAPYKITRSPQSFCYVEELT